MTPAIEIRDLVKSFGRVRALDGLSLTVPEGSLLGLIGRNGAGKTTTFNVLAGFLKPTSGSVVVRGEALVAGEPPVGKIALLPQDARMPEHRRVGDVLRMLGCLSGLSPQEADRRSEQAMESLALGKDTLGRKVGHLSHGQRRRVAIAQALVGRDEVIILDEPLAGLDPRAAAELRELIVQLKSQRTMILSSHDLHDVESLCDHFVIIEKGRTVSSGTVASLREESAAVRVSLAQPAPDPEAMSAQISAVSGVRRVQLSEDGLAVTFELTDGDGVSADAVINEVIKALMAAGGVMRGVERGTSLEQRFLDETER